MNLEKLRITEYSDFYAENEISGGGKNHILFVGILLFTYGLIITMSWYFYPLILLVIPVYYYTRNPLNFSFHKFIIWHKPSVPNKQYHYHKRFSLLGLDIYILNNRIFAPGRSLQPSMKETFDLLDERLKQIIA